MLQQSPPVDMDISANSTVISSDESSYGDSSGPATPLCGPVVHPVIVRQSYDAGSQFEHFLDFAKQQRTFSALSVSSKDSSRTSISYDTSPRYGVENICFVGAGYVGGPTAAMIALHNPDIRVEVVDRDIKRIRRWNSRHLPIHEPGLSEIVRISRDGARAKATRHQNESREDEFKLITWERQPNLFFSNDISGSISRADIIFLAVNTSTKTFGIGAGEATDMSAFDSAVRQIAAHARPHTIIVEKSTVPCGTAERIKSTLQSLRSNTSFEVLSNPEFLSEGSAINDMTNTDRVIIGCFNTPSGYEAADVLAKIYASWVPRSKILTSNVWSSELSKLVANAMLGQRISSMNAISAICEETGADVDEIAKSVGLDTRIGSKFLKAGLGYGGSCFRKDIASLTYLAKSLGLDDVAEYWSQVNKMNESQRMRFARRVIRRLDGNLVGKKIAVLGFAFKANTGDSRESVAVEVIKDLLEERPAEIAIFDVYCKKSDIVTEVDNKCGDGTNLAVRVYENLYDACKEADGIIIATECDEFRNPPDMRACFTTSDRLCKKLTTPELEEDVEISNLDSRTWYTLTRQISCTAGAESGFEECPECPSDINTTDSVSPNFTGPVDWKKVVLNMRAPRWIFDGRNILDIEAIQGYGISVNIESIGRR